MPTNKVEKGFLPIEDFREEILDAVEKNSALIITAETGAGKTTQVPQYLAEKGYRVVVTQPRRLAATSVAMRVAEEMEVEIGGQEVGYRTAYEAKDDYQAQILFCTDGLQLVREITGSGRAQVLIIDEVHEWNRNIETLVAWANKRLTEGCDFKVVIMSATLDSTSLAQFFNNCPVIEVPGRLYPVEEKQSMANPAEEAIRLAKEGRNVLVFQPGKKEIEETISKIKSELGETAIVLPLHGQLEHSDQRACFRRFDQPKVIVSTNVAQTSVTIPDIDAVVDSGLERRLELADGIEGLYLKEISQADCKQRAGRAGRTKEGVYILCGKTENRQEFPTAEIQRVRLDQLVLRLAAAGFDATKLEFFHQPDKAALLDAKRALHALGAMTEDGQVTKIGHLMTKLPCSVQYARMIVEANRLGVADDVLTIAAILEVGGLRDRSNSWRAYTKEDSSDLLAELDLWNACQGLQNGQIKGMGVFSKAYYKAKEIRQHLAMMAKKEIRFGSTHDRESIKRACTAGMVDHLYQNRGGEYRNGKGGARQKARESVVAGTPDWIVGLPKDIEFTNTRGRKCVLNLVSMITKVDPSWLLEIAPQLAATTRRNYAFSTETQTVMCDLVHIFNGQEVKVEKVEANQCLDATKALADGLAAAVLQNEIFKETNAELSDLQAKSGGAARGKLSREEITKIYLERLGNVYTLRQIAEQKIDLTLPRSIFVSDEDANYIRQENPDTVEIGNEVCKVSYEYSSWAQKQTVTIKVSVTTIQTVSQPETENLIPSGVSYQLALKDEGYTSIQGTDVVKLREKIEARRLDLAWEKFSQDNPSRHVEVKGLEPLPETDKPRIFDEITGAQAFSALTCNSWGEWRYLGWFRTQEEAEKKQAEAIKIKARLDAEEDERINFDLRVSEARQALAEVEKLFGRIDFDQYDQYGISEEEAGKSSWYGNQSLAYQVEQVKRYLPEESYRRAQPREAMSLLEPIRARIEKALDYKARNAQMETEARKIDNRVKALDEIGLRDELANAGELSLSEEERKSLGRLVYEITKAVNEGKFLPAVEAFNLASDLITKAESAKNFLDAQVASGKILLNFTAWHRRGGARGCGDGWVIRPDGSRRERDTDDVRCHKSDGNYIWRRVMPDELALRWTATERCDEPGAFKCEVVKTPVGGPTLEQLETVRQLEDEIGAIPGQFPIDSIDVGQVTHDANNRIRVLFPSCPLCGGAMTETSDEHELTLTCNNYCQHPDERHVAWSTSNSGLTEYDTATIAVVRAREKRDIVATAKIYKGGTVMVSWTKKPDPREFAREDFIENIILTDAVVQAKTRERYESDRQYAEEQVSNGYWLELSFRKGRHPKTGETQWEAGSKHVKFVLDRNSAREPVEGKAYYASIRRELVTTSTFQLSLVRLEPPYPEDEPMLSPEGESTTEPGQESTPEESESGFSLADLKAKFKK